MEKRLKFLANTCYLLGIAAAVLLYTHHTFGNPLIIKLIFYVCGAMGLIFSLLQFRFQDEHPEDEFNLLYWLGSLVIYLGFVVQLAGIKYYTYLLILGLLVTGASFFINPFKTVRKKQDDLLDES